MKECDRDAEREWPHTHIQSFGREGQRAMNKDDEIWINFCNWNTLHSDSGCERVHIYMEHENEYVHGAHRQSKHLNDSSIFPSTVFLRFI